MAKKRGVDTIPWDIEQYLRTEKVVREIETIYRAAIDEAVNIGLQAKGRGTEDVPFSFDVLPQTKARMSKLLLSLTGKMVGVINVAQGNAWEYAAQKNDALLESLFRSTKIPRDVIETYKDRNLDALTSFQKRKVNGLGLSDRVWKQAEQFKQEMEMSLDMGLGEGKSAAQLSKDVREYLNEPDRLFRRVRDKRGNLHLSKNAKAYQPGRGNYRSSYKNAMRVTRSEVNMAYRESDYTRWQQLEFIVGYEIKLSNNHPVKDICDRLAGKYPKDFKFTSWHPHCRCHAIPILATDKEIAELERKLLNEEELGGFRSKNEVRDVPENFKDWVCDNKDRIDRAKSKPYFVLQNPNYVEKARYMSVDRLDKAHKFMLADDYYRHKSDEANALLSKRGDSIHIAHASTVRDYSGNGYKHINRYTRQGEIGGRNAEYLDIYSRVLSDAIDKWPKRYTGNVFRGAALPQNVIDEYENAFKSGRPKYEKSFLSTSKLEGEAFEGNAFFEISVTNQADISEYSMFRTEEEVLLKAGNRYRVSSFVKTEGGKYIVKMELI